MRTSTGRQNMSPGNITGVFSGLQGELSMKLTKSWSFYCIETPPISKANNFSKTRKITKVRCSQLWLWLPALWLHRKENLETVFHLCFQESAPSTSRAGQAGCWKLSTSSAVEWCLALQGSSNPGALEKFTSRTGSAQADWNPQQILESTRCFKNFLLYHMNI